MCELEAGQRSLTFFLAYTEAGKLSEMAACF